ncbi:MAG: sugar ABC transporter ATP-binding protein [Planctomycetales bacterium]|nr:sugar ABC transporter ATP-binding protein [Planctomycetales bacterium]
MQTNSLLELSQISKGFFGIPVLEQVTLSVAPGQSLGLVGENGAGKSTLMNILGGNIQPDSGSMNWTGSAYRPHWPRDAEAAGIAFIHQELNLFPNLNVAENIFLADFPCRGFWIRRLEMFRRTKELLGQVGLAVSPQTPVVNLTAGEKQLVEIAKALHRQPKLLILDEPTTSLSEREIVHLFKVLRALQQQGMAMIYISHVLQHVQQLCSTVAVLRDGSIVGHGPVEHFSPGQLVALMVGRELEQHFPRIEHQPTDRLLLRAEALSQPGVIENVSLAVHEHEVIGIAGLMGSGRTEMARILFGLDSCSSGRVSVYRAGEMIEITKLPVSKRVQVGMALLTESRRDDGLCMSASIDENLGVVAGARFTVRGVLNKSLLRSSINRTREAVRLTPTASGRQAVRTLSGGNQQKVVLAKWLLNEPRILILDEPTRGIDVGAKFEIYRLIDELACKGAGIIIISSEIEELIGTCDRIIVMRKGEITNSFDRSHFDREAILNAALHSIEQVPA